MSVPQPEGVTELLVAWRSGDRDALEKLAPLVDSELRRLAQQYMRNERADHTLQPTALVNEAYVRLLAWKGAAEMNWQNRAHFIAVAANIMRRILIDYARRQGDHKRGGTIVRVSLDSEEVVAGQDAPDFVALDEALTRLSEIDPRKGQVVELRVFGGLSVEEVAEVTNSSPRTVKRDWSFALAWLHCELTGAQTHDT